VRLLAALLVLVTQPVQPLQPVSLLADVVVIGVPGLRWSDVEASPELTALAGQAHVGSISVKTAGPHTCPVAGWLTINAGTRAWGPCEDPPPVVGGRVQNWQSYLDAQTEHHTDAELGRLGALGNELCGFGPGGAVAVAKADGTVARWRPEFETSALAGCRHAVVDAGGLPLDRVAGLVEQARAADRWVLLVGISDPAEREALVAMQMPPDDGPRWLTSASTRRPGLIQLTDITATLTAGAPDGSQIGFGGDRHTDTGAVIEDRLDTNERFEKPRPVLVAVGISLVIAQLAALAWFVVRRTRASRRTFAATLLTQGGFFSAVFLSTVTSWWRWPSPGVALFAVTVGLSAAVAAVSFAVWRRRAVFGVVAVPYLVLLVDGVLGTPLQVGSMFADGPVIGGRFYGFGNSTFAALAVATLVTAGWIAQRLLASGRDRRTAAAAVLAIGGAAIVVEGVPQWGADFGGVISLTPAVLLLALFTWRGTVSVRALAAVVLAGFVVVAAFSVADYQRAPGDRSHLGKFVGRVLDGDAGDVIARKLSMSFSFLEGPGGWAMLAAVVAVTAACLVPNRVPFAAYRSFVETQPLARPVLLALVLCGLIGMLLNDAGVTVPAIMGGFAVPTLVAHLLLNPRDSLAE
jgi:hypothetical protein